MSTGVGRGRGSVVLLLLAGLAALPAAGQDDSALVRRIEDWVDGLGDSSWSVREEAHKSLLDAGEPAIPALKRAATDPDPERARRARQILDATLWGEPPDVSSKAAEFVREFGKLPPKERADRVSRFAGAAGERGRPFLLRVLEHDLDPAVRGEAFRWLALQEDVRLDSEIEQALARGEDAESASLLGQLLKERGRVVEAVSALRLAVERDPADASHRHVLALTLFGMGRWREALAEFETSLEEEEKAFVRCALLSGAARCQFRLGQDEAAFETVCRLLKEGSGSDAVRRIVENGDASEEVRRIGLELASILDRFPYAMAEGALRWGAHLEGLAWLYREGSRRFPEDPQFPAALGDLLYRSQDMKGALPALEEALARASAAEDLVLAADRLARARFETGVSGGEADGKSPRDLILAACEEREAGRFESSCAAWRAALAVTPEEALGREFAATLEAWRAPEAALHVQALRGIDADWARRESNRVFEALARGDPPEQPPAAGPAEPDKIERALSTGRETDRMAAARLLGGLEEETALRLARLALADRSASVRLACVGSLARLRPEAVRPLLVETLRDPAWRVAFKAAGALLASGDLSGMEILVEALHHPKSAVRQQALRELVGSGNHEACGPLRELAGDPGESIRRIAIESLGRLGQDSDVPLFAAALEDSSPSVRSAAVDALLALEAKGEVLERAAGTARRLSIEEPLDYRHPLAWARAELALGRPPEAMAAARVAIWVRPASRDARELLKAARESLPEDAPDRAKFARIPGGWRVSSSGR
ncbi:MAG: HEAT repeat domain-containing protein [Planctomycetes bacterium]|nr:HEAT repeat domain-containing protein [Planctomycetota bacterium]